MKDELSELIKRIDEIIDQECSMTFEVDFNSMKCSRCNEVVKTDFNPIMPLTITLLPMLMRAVQIDHYLNKCNE